jgi:alpha-L-fucosidase
MSDLEEFRSRQLPAWFTDAKLGIFVHWYPATIPAFAPLTDDPFALAAEHGIARAFSHSPYAEWYQNALAIPGSPVAEHHAEHWPDVPYDEFVRRFRETVQQWDPAAWAEEFAATGARYVVMGAKHHDGVTMWPSRHPNPHRAEWFTERNAVVELADEVRARGLRYGVYYSGGLDWTFRGIPIDSIESLIAAIPQDDAYSAYVDAHWRELIELVNPDVLWNDIAYPRAANAHRLFADYYEANPEGVVNDRFDVVGVRAGTAHADFITQEYSSGPGPEGFPFEVCRGIGRSFGYNALEGPDDHLGPDELVRLFVDVVADGGNLLLNVGPTATGEIPPLQTARLRALGGWLRTNEDAVTASRPWTRSVGTSGHGSRVRYTSGRNGSVYALVHDRPPTGYLDLDVRPVPGARLARPGHRGELAWEATDTGCRVDLHVAPPPGPPLVVSMSSVMA